MFTIYGLFNLVVEWGSFHGCHSLFWDVRSLVSKSLSLEKEDFLMVT